MQAEDARTGDAQANSGSAAVVSAAAVRAGRCYCGAVQYEVTGEFAYALNCHCSNCRRTTGSAFKPFAGIAREALQVTLGEAGVMRYGDELAHDAHCRACGSLLYSLVREGRYVHVTLGTLEGDPGIRPGAHIFVGSKAPWFTITDDLPHFEELPS